MAAKAKPAKKATKASAKPATSKTPARGVELIEKVIATLDPKKIPKPLSAAVIVKLQLGNGAPLPPSLARFLAVHGPHDQFPGLWRPGTWSSLNGVFIGRLIEQTYEKGFHKYFDIAGIANRVPGLCHPLTDVSPLSFLYIGVPDQWGEYPILTLQDYDDVFEVVVDYPGIDVYLAARARVIEPPRYYGGLVEDAVYGPMLKATVRANFRKPERSQKRYVFGIDPVG